MKQDKPVALPTAGLWVLGGLAVIWFWGFVWGWVGAFLYFKR